MLEFPHRKIILMAIIDSVQFCGLSLAAAGVSPTMTVILLHASTPCLVITTKYFYPDRSYSSVQMKGVYVIIFAILVSISRPIIQLFFVHHFTSVWHSFAYLFFSAMHGFATLYKERTLVEWAQPIDIHYISSWLFFYQCVASVLLTPVLYLFQGDFIAFLFYFFILSATLSLCFIWFTCFQTNFVVFYFLTDLINGGSGFPITSLFQNLRDGWSCVFGSDPDQGSSSYDTSYANCQYSFWLVLAYVLSTMIVLTCINTVLQISHRTLGRSLAAAVCLAFLVLGAYDSTGTDRYGAVIIGDNVGWSDICSIIVLLVGLEIYGRDPEPDVEVITNFAPIAAPRAPPNS